MIFWPLLPFLGLFLGVQSQECEPPGDVRYFNVTSQEYIDALSSFCTTMLGTLMIANNFTGDFVLPNITNITGGIMLDWWDFKPTPPVTVLDLPDLQYLESSIDIMALMDTLERISLPKLEYLRQMTLIQYIDGAEVDFSGLKKVDNLHVRGNYSKVGFDSLQNVTEKMTICNTYPCGIWFEEIQAPRHAMEVSLPNLEVAKLLEIHGDVSDLIAPKLSEASLTVRSLNTSVRFDFPYLRNANYRLDLQGKITGVVLPNLKNFSRFLIESDLPLDCDKVVDRINETRYEPVSEHWMSCESPYEKPSGLSTKVKIVIGVVVGVVGLGIILGGIFFWRKKRASKRTKRVGMSGSAVELTSFGAGQGREGSGQGQGQVQAEQHEPPPPYTADRH